MEILVFSDSHGQLDAMKQGIEGHNISTIFHLGDHYEDALSLKQCYPEKKFYCVIGNNDYATSPLLKTITLDGEKILLCHSHTLQGRAGVDGIVQKAKNLGCSIALYGHTHIAKAETMEDIYIANPGSITRSLDQNPPSYGILDTSTKTLSHIFISK